MSIDFASITTAISIISATFTIIWYLRKFKKSEQHEQLQDVMINELRKQHGLKPYAWNHETSGVLSIQEAEDRIFITELRTSNKIIKEAMKRGILSMNLDLQQKQLKQQLFQMEGTIIEDKRQVKKLQKAKKKIDKKVDNLEKKQQKLIGKRGKKK